jgi:hypothetical protein
MYSSPNIFRVVETRKLRWTVHIARMGDRRGDTGFWWENLREDPGVDWMIILT